MLAVATLPSGIARRRAKFAAEFAGRAVKMERKEHHKCRGANVFLSSCGGLAGAPVTGLTISDQRPICRQAWPQDGSGWDSS